MIDRSDKEDALERAKRTMGALVHQPLKLHDKIKLGKSRAKVRDGRLGKPQRKTHRGKSER
jgi:hypothetical protein